jgi:16S rRNA (adenine1518-N6/adenine1519-N6)-dimethyltransferase
MGKLSKVRFNLATLVTGKKFAYEVQASPYDSNYGRLSALIQGRYQPQLIREVPKEAFWPPPRVNSAILNLKPYKQKSLISRLRPRRLKPGTTQFIMGELVMQPDKQVKNALREAIIRFEDLQGRSGTKREAREIIKQLNLSDQILSKMPEQLSNQDFQSIAIAIDILMIK